MGEVASLVFKTHHRIARLIGEHDSVTNNTTADVTLKNELGSPVIVLTPGAVFAPEKPTTVYFDAAAKFSFRVYLNEEKADVDHTY